MSAARCGLRSSALILMKFVVASGVADTWLTTCAASAGGCIERAASCATGVVEISSAIALTFEVEKLPPLARGPVLTVIALTPTSAVERYVSGLRSESASAAAGTATTHARKRNFQRHSARR